MCESVGNPIERVTQAIFIRQPAFNSSLFLSFIHRNPRLEEFLTSPRLPKPHAAPDQCQV